MVEGMPVAKVQAAYDETLRMCRRMSDWLDAHDPRDVGQAKWDAHFERYQQELAALHRLGNALRPLELRPIGTYLHGEALTREVFETFGGSR